MIEASEKKRQSEIEKLERFHAGNWGSEARAKKFIDMLDKIGVMVIENAPTQY